MHKKILFLQNKGRSLGGVWQVNRVVGEKLIEKGYDVSVVSLRNNPTDQEVEHDARLKIDTINKKELWGTYSFTGMKQMLKKGRLFTFVKMLFTRIHYEITMKRDTRSLHCLINAEKPDHIITTQYQLLDMIPKNYLATTIHEQHSDFVSAYKHKATRETLLKYNGKIKFLWLTKATMHAASEVGFVNNSFIYNAVRFECEKTADVTNNKKLITICRLVEQKNIQLMIEIVEEIFDDEKYKDWSLEIYGDGPLEKQLREQITNRKQVKLMGNTNDPKSALLSSSINLNTSNFEGFAMSILEANECGVPTISLNFGESVYEQIIDEETGMICKDKQEYMTKLKELMLDQEKLNNFSKNCKEYSQNFHIEHIIDDWIFLLES